MRYIGFDVGSTCTKAVVLDEQGSLVFSKVVPTGWNCIETAESLLGDMEAQGIHKKQAMDGYPYLLPIRLLQRSRAMEEARPGCSKATPLPL